MHRSQTMVQQTEEFATERDAAEALVALSEQDGYRGGRLRPPHPRRANTWGVQAFFTDEAPEGCDWLPDGCRRVLASFVPRVLGVDY